MKYAEDIISGRKIACLELVQTCKRFKQDLDNAAYDFRIEDAEFVIRIIEKTIVHQQDEDLNGEPLRGRPFLLQPWQKFIIYNLLGFFHKGTKLRRFKECFLYIPRKKGKIKVKTLKDTSKP